MSLRAVGVVSFVCTLFRMALQRMTRCGEPLQLHAPLQLQSWVGIFAQHHTEGRAIAGPRAFSGLCDEEGVPLICPTCQVLAQGVPLPATLHGVVFDIFGRESRRRGVAARSLLEAAHTGEAFAVAEWRTRHDSNVW